MRVQPNVLACEVIIVTSTMAHWFNIKRQIVELAFWTDDSILCLCAFDLRWRAAKREVAIANKVVSTDTGVHHINAEITATVMVIIVAFVTVVTSYI